VFEKHLSYIIHGQGDLFFENKSQLRMKNKNDQNQSRGIGKTNPN
jgi:hypothetical protein